MPPAGRLGIPVGVYYYTYAQDAATVQAELAKLHEALAGKTFTLPIAVDVEDNKLKPLSADALTDLVIAAADAIESWGPVCHGVHLHLLQPDRTFHGPPGGL